MGDFTVLGLTHRHPDILQLTGEIECTLNHLLVAHGVYTRIAPPAPVTVEHVCRVQRRGDDVHGLPGSTAREARHASMSFTAAAARSLSGISEAHVSWCNGLLDTHRAPFRLHSSVTSRQ